MNTAGEHDVTRLIAAWRSGDSTAREALVERVYANVRAIAAQSLRQMPCATLSATDIAHEALIRLLGADAEWENRRHFFHVAAQATRQVLVDAARRRLSAKRGGAAERVELDEAHAVASQDSDADLIRVDRALQDLGATDARRAQTIELVYFGGLSRQEVAAALEVSEGTVDRDLRLARAWLRSALDP
ncbi:MAG: ECF-type sigma factor [Dokdonella sp.]